MECSNCGDVGCHQCSDDNPKKKIIYSKTSFNTDEFTIYGCGKFSSEKKILDKAEAALLYIELHKFLFNNKG